MKRSIMLLFAVMVLGTSAYAQLESPITWAYGARKISATEAEVQIRATLDKGWHLYSQTLKPNGPQPTKIAFQPSKDFTLVGKTMEPKPITYYDKNFKMNVSYFANQVVFKQRIKIPKGAAVVKGTVEFMVCDDTKCLPPNDVTFSIPVK